MNTPETKQTQSNTKWELRIVQDKEGNIFSMQEGGRGKVGIANKDGFYYEITGKTKKEAEANAQKIVKCVNQEHKIDMHEELVSVLSDLLSFTDVLPIENNEADENFIKGSKARKEAYKLLKKAQQK